MFLPEKFMLKSFLDSLRYCQENKGLEIYAWVIMSNHCHFILRSNGHNLSDVIRDFKKYTAKKVVQAIKDNIYESRKKWLLWLFKKDDHIWFWEEGYHGEEINSRNFFDTKANYIHLNPVRAGLVEKEEEYLNICLAVVQTFTEQEKGLWL
jgi:REP element-mobilizing transposase RayT